VNTVSTSPVLEVAFSGGPDVPPAALTLIQKGLPGQVAEEVGAVQVVK
jgi:hypothetical protein